MCPICLTSLAVTVAATTGVGAAVTAVVVKVKRSLTRDERLKFPTARTEDSP